jgi:Domain of unknown function (DUF1844)
MSEEKSGAEKTFQVRDRRRFDSDGNERTVEKEAAPARPAPSTAGVTAAGPATFAASANGDSNSGSEISFSSFVMSLATQALVQLGQMDAPPGMELPFDPESAMQTIDILMMLQGKTKGNLSDVESKLLEDILHNLRVVYVQRVRGEGGSEE